MSGRGGTLLSVFESNARAFLAAFWTVQARSVADKLVDQNDTPAA